MLQIQIANNLVGILSYKQIKVVHNWEVKWKEFTKIIHKSAACTIVQTVQEHCLNSWIGKNEVNLLKEQQLFMYPNNLAFTKCR